MEKFELPETKLNLKSYNSLNKSKSTFEIKNCIAYLLQLFQQPLRNFVPITSYQNDVNYDGSYTYSYISGDGSQQQARGFVKNLGQKEIEAQVVQGSYSYTSPEGQPITVTYVADENGMNLYERYNAAATITIHDQWINC